jgi:hypothetical protein
MSTPNTCAIQHSPRGEEICLIIVWPLHRSHNSFSAKLPLNDCHARLAAANIAVDADDFSQRRARITQQTPARPAKAVRLRYEEQQMRLRR